MKYSIIIADSKLIAKSDIKTWIDIGKKSIEPKSELSESLIEIINIIKSKFPKISNYKNSESYMIFEEYSDFFAIDIEYEDIEYLKKEILEIALEKGFAVLIGKENKIYKPTMK